MTPSGMLQSSMTTLLITKSIYCALGLRNPYRLRFNSHPNLLPGRHLQVRASLGPPIRSAVMESLRDIPEPEQELLAASARENWHGFGQSCVEPVSISLISDPSGGSRDVFIGESVLHVSVYIGEAISGQIATAFTENGESWRVALRAIGIAGIVVTALVRLLVRDRRRLPGIIVDDKTFDGHHMSTGHVMIARSRLAVTVAYLIRM